MRTYSSFCGTVCSDSTGTVTSDAAVRLHRRYHLNSYRIEAKDKGKVTDKNINELISNNTGKLKRTLIELNEYIKNCH